jgi:peptidoglycan/LPS O-acetylase OafA/YrhL
MRLNKRDSAFINQLRGLSMLCIVLGHLGLFWLYTPFTELLHSMVPVFFFVSGVVAYYTLKSAKTVRQFYVKRFVGLLVPYYLACVLSIAVYLAIYRAFPTFDWSLLIRWMTISPTRKSMPFPLGQVWFLHALAIITVLLPWIMASLRRSTPIALLLLLPVLIVSYVQLFDRIDRSFYALGHNFYQALIAFAFVTFGATWFLDERIRRRSVVWTIFLVSVAVAVGSIIGLGLDIDLSKHAYAPNLYYLSMGYAAIALLLLAQPVIERLCSVFTRIDYWLQFFGRHSYSIFLLHTFFIWGSEQWLGLVDVGESPVHAILKVTFVLSTTAVVAPYFTWLCDRIVPRVLAKLQRRGGARYDAG